MMKHVNQVWFDGIHLYKDEFGNSYAYDDNGNVIRTTASQSIKTDVGSDTTNEQLESPLAPAIGGGPLSAEEMAREEELFEKRAKAAGAEQGHRLFRLCPDGEVRFRRALQPCRERRLLLPGRHGFGRDGMDARGGGFRIV